MLVSFGFFFCFAFFVVLKKIFFISHFFQFLILLLLSKFISVFCFVIVFILFFFSFFSFSPLNVILL
jgi:hypothetical protein